MPHKAGRGEEPQRLALRQHNAAVFVNMNVEKHCFQISFRGMTREVLDRIINTGINRNGHFEGHYLQPIATALYQYSYMLRWKGLQKNI